jgi:hypothetical protein
MISTPSLTRIHFKLLHFPPTKTLINPKNPHNDYFPQLVLHKSELSSNSPSRFDLSRPCNKSDYSRHGTPVESNTVASLRQRWVRRCLNKKFKVIWMTHFPDLTHILPVAANPTAPCRPSCQSRTTNSLSTRTNASGTSFHVWIAENLEHKDCGKRYREIESEEILMKRLFCFTTRLTFFIDGLWVCKCVQVFLVDFHFEWIFKAGKLNLNNFF